MQARMIFYLRCAAYLRPLPRTRQQQKQLLPQTHSRGRAMLASITKINLPPCIGVFVSFLFHLHDGAACRMCSYCIKNIVLHMQSKADISIPLTHRLCSTHLKRGNAYSAFKMYK